MYIDNNLFILNDIIVIAFTGCKELTGLLITAGKNDEHVFIMEERLSGNRLVFFINFLQVQSHISMFQFQHFTVQLVLNSHQRRELKKHIRTIRKNIVGSVFPHPAALETYSS